MAADDDRDAHPSQNGHAWAPPDPAEQPAVRPAQPDGRPVHDAQPGWPPMDGAQPGWPPMAGAVPPAPATSAARSPGLLIGLSAAGSVLMAGVLLTGAIVLYPGEAPPLRPAAAPPSPSPLAPPINEPRRTLEPPRAVSGYERQTGKKDRWAAAELRATIEDVEVPGQEVRTFGAAGAKAIKSELYSNGAGRTLHLLGLDFVALGRTGVGGFYDPPSDVDQMLGVFGATTPVDRPAGRYGGVLRCSKGLQQGRRWAAVCIWSDRSVMGIVIAPLLPPDRLAPIALRLREAAEH
ncbi:hypothetical protein [Spirillospora sp. NBC_01491]|uniref:hypothetical protein n=1 Tax=Spirillospora sp. NBC_01491 TaxID=2976007 RepID=UPI002E2F42AA|nr:hypothetical protein [Spirillospora sp. NBC_01491]